MRESKSDDVKHSFWCSRDMMRRITAYRDKLRSRMQEDGMILKVSMSDATRTIVKKGLEAIQREETPDA